MAIYRTNITSLTGPYFYSDQAFGIQKFLDIDLTITRSREEFKHIGSYDKIQDPALNKLARIPLLGLVAGIVRIALGVIHILGHLLAAPFAREQGNLGHAAKGGCEILRGVIESIPIIGRIFANTYSPDPHTAKSRLGISCSGNYFIMKIYNASRPDTLDQYSNNWNPLNIINVINLPDRNITQGIIKDERLLHLYPVESKETSGCVERFVYLTEEGQLACQGEIPAG